MPRQRQQWQLGMEIGAKMCKDPLAERAMLSAASLRWIGAFRSVYHGDLVSVNFWVPDWHNWHHGLSLEISASGICVSELSHTETIWQARFSPWLHETGLGPPFRAMLCVTVG